MAQRSRNPLRRSPYLERPPRLARRIGLRHTGGVVERTDPAGDEPTPAPDSHRISIGVVELRAGDDMADPEFRRLHDTMLDECVVPASRKGFGARELFQTGEV